MTDGAGFKRPCVAAFDFDVTITSRDTFVPFLKLAFGSARLRCAFIALAFEAAKVVLGMSDRDRFKALLIRKLFLGQSTERLQQAGELHARQVMKWVRPAALARIAWHRQRGDRLVMVSASLDLYLEPVARLLGFDDLLCTRESRADLLFDGAMQGRNCRGPEKVARLQALLGPLGNFDVYAYGDSDGDKEMLQVANHPFYRAFAPGGALF